MTPQEFVTEVYHIQEGVIIDDLWPTDDKYKEVLYWANKAISEFCLLDDWSFLRKSIILGSTTPTSSRKIPKYQLPDNVDHVSMLYQDSLKLYKYKKTCCDIDIDESNYLCVPFASKGNEKKREFMQYKKDLYARVYDKYIEFNRVPSGNEKHRLAICDCQIKPKMFHICNEKCIGKNKKKPIEWDESSSDYNPCSKVETSVLDIFPTPDYFVWKTAYYSSLHSPIAQAAKIDIDNTCKTMLSNIRKVDSNKTVSDIIERPYSFIPKQFY